MRTKAKLVAALAAVAMVAAACNNGDPGASPAPEETAPSLTAATLQVVEHPDLGHILADGSGRTVYASRWDGPGLTDCVDQCAVTWPPLDPDGDPSAGDGVDEALLGTITRPDGATQVTYNDRPIYHYSGDVAPGDTNGLYGLYEGSRFAVSPEGEFVFG